MIQTVSSIATPLAQPPAAPPRQGTGEAVFALPSDDGAAAAARQASAGSGKDLPEAEAPEEDAPSTADSLMFAWFTLPGSIAAPPPPSTAIAVPQRAIAPPLAAPIATGAPVVGEGSPTPAAPAAPPADPHLVAPTISEAPAPAAEPALSLPRDSAANPPARAVAAQPRDAAAPAIPPAPTPPAPPAPATLTSAAALAAPLFQLSPEPAAPRRTALREPLTGIASLTPGTPADAAALPVAAPSAAPDAALDLRHQQWTGQMIERIEMLRDAGPVRETRIRLAPDALGSVDIAIRHDGERLDVRFTAETATARQLLGDAQPRLSELAEARGLRLGQTSVEGGGAGQGQARQHRPDPAPASTPAPPRAPAAETAHTDTRIA